jgi:D-glycero-alpha-D-manno-heptose-7-phosphate kinase
MIIVRSPLRITLGGGGTDLSSYYRQHEGFLIAAAIDKYVYITLHHSFKDELQVRYSKVEHVSSLEDVQHPVVREALKLLTVNWHGLEIGTMADIPANTELGSSSSFTTALIRALHVYHGRTVHPEDIAEQACEIEISRLGEPIGKQDQYISALGGIRCFRFLKDGRVESWPVPIAPETLHNLEEGLAMFFTGFTSQARAILEEQNEKSTRSDKEIIDNLNFIKQLGLRSLEALQGGLLNEFGRLLDEHWQHKKQRSNLISNSKIDEWYELAMANGATGGKLIGAGGGGFLLFHAKDKPKLRRAMLASGLREVRFRFDFDGTKVVAQ